MRRLSFADSAAKIVIVISAIFGQGIATASPDYTTYGVVTTVNGRDVGLDVSIPSASNPMGCSTPGLFRLASSATNYTTVASTLLLGYAAGRNVRVYAYSCDSDGASLISAATSA